MLGKVFVVCVLSIMVTIGTQSREAMAGHKTGKIIAGIAVAVGAALIAETAASAANANRGRDRYDYHHGISKADNAVAACIHKADKLARKAGALYLRLDKVRKVVHTGKNKFKVVAKITMVHPNRHKQFRMKCVAKHGDVKSLSYN